MDHELSQKKQAGLLVFYGLMFILGILFLALIPTQTRPGPEGQGWWTQPALMPTLSLLTIAVPATILLVQEIIKTLRRAEIRPNLPIFGKEMLGWLLPLEFFVYFRIYMWLFEWVGYFLASLIFIFGLCLRVGLRRPRWYIISIVTAFALVVMFKWGLNVYMPRPEVFKVFPELFPKPLQDFWQEWL